MDIRAILIVASSAWLSACGGGAFSWDPAPVTGITATNLRLGQTATLHLTGNALNNAITITSDKCTAINAGQIGSAHDRIASCQVTGTGPINFTVSSSSGHVVYSTNLTVPEPVTDIQPVGMARSTAFNSATSQFYVNLRDNTGFDYVSSAQPGYAVFGMVVSGTDTIDKIAGQPTQTVTTYGTGNVATTFNNVPVTDITITSASQTQ